MSDIKLGARVKINYEGIVTYINSDGTPDVNLTGSQRTIEYVPLEVLTVLPSAGAVLSATELTDADLPVGTVINDSDDIDSVVRFARTSQGWVALTEFDGDNIHADSIDEFQIRGLGFTVEYIPTERNNA